MDPKLLAVFIGIAFGAVGYWFTTFSVQPILRYRKYKYQILMNFIYYAQVVNANELNKEMKDLYKERVLANRKSSAQLTASALELPWWYVQGIKIKGQAPKDAAKKLIGYSNTTDYDRANEIEEFVRKNLGLPEKYKTNNLLDTKGEDMSEVKWTDIGALIVAIAVPISLYISGIAISTQQHEDAKAFRNQQLKIEFDNRTISKLNQLNSVVSLAVSEKAKLDFENNALPPKNYSYEYVNDNVNILPNVLTILNEYESLCLGLNLNLYSEDIIKVARGSALKLTFKDYAPFIAKWREYPGAEDAWQQCIRYLGKKT